VEFLEVEPSQICSVGSSRLNPQASQLHLQEELISSVPNNLQLGDYLERLNSNQLLVDSSGQLSSNPQEGPCSDSNQPGRTRYSEPSLLLPLVAQLFSAVQAIHNPL
jgi:hypothetical protein